MAGRIKADDGEARVTGATSPASDEWRIWSGEEFIEFACRHAFNPVTGPTAALRTAIQKQMGYYRTSLSHTDDLGNVASHRHTRFRRLYRPDTGFCAVASPEPVGDGEFVFCPGTASSRLDSGPSSIMKVPACRTNTVCLQWFRIALPNGLIGQRSPIWRGGRKWRVR